MRSTKRSRLSRWVRWAAATLLAAALGMYGFWVASCFLLKWLDPATTAVQIERRLDALWLGKPYRKQYKFVPLQRISPDLQHAVIASEDERFRQHSGIDWVELRKVIEQDLERGKRPSRGASTISQQLVKNLFLSTTRSGVRKVLEFAIVPAAEAILGKDRILELYLNVIEWGPGIYGAEAAAQAYYKVPAERVNRDQAARLAACIPAPSRRRPAAMGNLAEIVETRMRQMGF